MWLYLIYNLVTGEKYANSSNERLKRHCEDRESVRRDKRAGFCHEELIWEISGHGYGVF